jgi:hypothetical protein
VLYQVDLAKGSLTNHPSDDEILQLGLLLQSGEDQSSTALDSPSFFLLFNLLIIIKFFIIQFLVVL